MTQRSKWFLSGAAALVLASQSVAFADVDDSGASHRSKFHNQKHINQDVFTTFSVKSGMRFHNLRQDGPSAITFNPGSGGNVTASNGVNNKYKFALMEFAAAAEVMLYGGFSFGMTGSYGALPGTIRCKTNVDWTQGAEPGMLNYELTSSKAYTYGLSFRVQKWFSLASWFKLSVLGGWGYDNLSLIEDSRTAFSAPFGGMNFCFAFAKTFSARLEAAYAFSGSRREKIRFWNEPKILTGVNFLSSALFEAKSGSVSGPKVSMDFAHTFYSGWQILGGAQWQYLRTPHRVINVAFTAPAGRAPKQNSSGTWDERTVWSSLGFWLGIEHNF